MRASTAKKSLLLILFAGLSLAAFAAILLNRNPFFIRPASVALRYSNSIYIPLVLLFLLAAYYPRRLVGIGTAMVATFILFAMVLNGLWAGGQSESVIVGGLFPYYDPHAYYIDALRWLAGYKFGEMSSMRPIFPAFLSLLFRLTGSSLQFSLALLALLTSLASFLFAQKVKERFGFFAAAFSLLLVYLYIRRIVGTTMTENLGLVFALLGFTALLNGVSPTRKGAILLGAFLISLSLNTRPGPFFILPAIILWGWWLVYDRTRKNMREAVLFATGIALCQALAFGVNSFVQKQTAGAELIPFANFSYALYGLVSGGRWFHQVFVDHPELAGLSGNDLHFTIFKLSFEVFKANPAGVIQGSFKHLKDFLLPTTWYSIFGYVSQTRPFFETASRAVLEGMSLFIIPAALRRRDDPHLKLIILVMAATLLSVPFVPPSDAHKLRLYAAVIPVIALLPALGFLECCRLIGRSAWAKLAARFSQEAPVRFPDAAVTVTALVLSAAAALSPLLTIPPAQPLNFAPVTCPAGEQGIVFEYQPGSTLFIWPGNRSFVDWMPNFHYNRFMRYLHGLPGEADMQKFQNFEAPAALLSTIDLATGRDIWLLADPNLLPAKTRTITAACTHQDGTLTVVDSVQPARATGE